MTTPAHLTAPRGAAGVAGGSPEAVGAAAVVLAAGGSAVDAVLAGAFAAVMSEPVLTSLGGGGFLLAADAGADPSILDFFVDVPGLAAESPGVAPHVETVVVDFARTGSAAASSEQVFHGGWGTVAVPGCLDGYLAAHRDRGRLPLSEVVAPAVRCAREGVQLSSGQRTFIHLVWDLLAITEDSRSLLAEVERTGRYANPGYAALLDALAAGDVARMADPPVRSALLDASRQGGGLLTAADLDAYRPQWRTALDIARTSSVVWTNPPPSVGGSIVVDALARVGPPDERDRVDWADVARALADATAAQRGSGQVSTGTTHLSVIDADGVVAAMTTSNGSGSGTVIPAWGITLNNMLGEEDLLPAGGRPLPPGARMGSMMAPTLVRDADGGEVVLGTGGSERIRSALLGVILRLVDERRSLADAVSAPRVHVTESGPIHVEPGLDDTDMTRLEEYARDSGRPPVERWPAPSLYFGGVHAVHRAADGSVTAVGDARRTGTVAVVDADGRIRTA